jgi:hypothetical protein
MNPTDPDLQHWNKPFYLVLYMIFCGVVYLQQLPVLYFCLMSGSYLLYCFLPHVPNLAEKQCCGTATIYYGSGSDF